MTDLKVHPVSLRFADPRIEREFADNWVPRLRVQARAALLLGIAVYLAYGLIDYWLLEAEPRSSIWMIRAGAALIALGVFGFTYSGAFARFSSVPLAFAGFVAGASLLLVFERIPSALLDHYYVGLVLIAFFGFNLVGARFIHALATNLVLLALYNLHAWDRAGVDATMLWSHDFFLVSANVLGGAAGYLTERQRRALFLREREIDAQRRHHQQRALHDPLTGLPNRELLQDRLEHALAQAQRHGELCAGYFIDLDGFKQVNDEWGHEVGDALLRSVADCLRNTLRESDTVARLGGDEFFVLAEQLPSMQAAVALGDKLLNALAYMVFDSQLHTHWGEMLHAPVNASIGACLFPYGSATAADVIRRADQAMYTAKRAGKGRCVFAPTLTTEEAPRRAVG